MWYIEIFSLDELSFNKFGHLEFWALLNMNLILSEDISIQVSKKYF